MNELLMIIAHFIVGLVKGALTCFGFFLLAILVRCFVDHIRGQIKKKKDKLAELRESTYSQVSKALCGKENATMEELLQAADQLKRERDVLMLHAEGCCETCAFLDDCAKHDGDPNGPYVRWYGDCEDWEWRGAKMDGDPDV